MELATQQILRKNIKQHELLKVQVHNSRFPPFIQSSDIITSVNSKDEQKMEVLTLLQSNDYDYIISTDRSTLKKNGNDSLGPSASAAIIFSKDNMREPVDVLSRGLGYVAHNYEAELLNICKTGV